MRTIPINIKLFYLKYIYRFLNAYYFIFKLLATYKPFMKLNIILTTVFIKSIDHNFEFDIVLVSVGLEVSPSKTILCLPLCD